MPSSKLLKLVLRVAIGCVVIVGVYQAIQKASDQLSAQRGQLMQSALQLQQRLDSEELVPEQRRQIQAEIQQLTHQASNFWRADWRCLLLGAVAYALGMLPSARYWLICLDAMGQRVPWQVGLWAYFYGNLGKYVPGKAMVVVMRVAELSQFGVRKIATVVSVFLETLTTMAVGGAVAAVSVILLDVDRRLSLIAVGGLLATVIPTAPGLIRLVIRKLQPREDKATLEEWTRRLNWRLTVKGWAVLGFTWIGFGLSLGSILYGLPSTQWMAHSATHFWLSVYAACSLAVVIGFVSMMPGGAGVRELALTVVLSPVVGPIAAVSSAVWLRVTWLATEILMAGICYLIKRSAADTRSP